MNDLENREDDKMIDDKRIKDKVDFFFEEKVKVHVVLEDRSWLNGYIEKKLKENVYWFIEDKLKGVYLFLKDIYEIEEFKEVEK